MYKKRRVVLPVSGERKDFCDYMNYELVKKINDDYYYYVPPGHVCRFTINFNRWKEGVFDKEKFLKKLEIN